MFASGFFIPLIVSISLIFKHLFYIYASSTMCASFFVLIKYTFSRLPIVSHSPFSSTACLCVCRASVCLIKPVKKWITNEFFLFFCFLVSLSRWFLVCVYFDSQSHSLFQFLFHFLFPSPRSTHTNFYTLYLLQLVLKRIKNNKKKTKNKKRLLLNQKLNLNQSPIASHYQLMEASDKEYICSLEKDNGMHRCELPPTKFNKMECTATVEDYLEFFRQPGNDYTSGALIGLPSSSSSSFLNHERTSSLINNQDQLLTTSYRATSSNFLSSSPIINDSMSSIDNFNTLFSLRDNETINCINWNRYYTKCKAGDKNPFQGEIRFFSIFIFFYFLFSSNTIVCIAQGKLIWNLSNFLTSLLSIDL